MWLLSEGVLRETTLRIRRITRHGHLKSMKHFIHLQVQNGVIRPLKPKRTRHKRVIETKTDKRHLLSCASHENSRMSEHGKKLSQGRRQSNKWSPEDDEQRRLLSLRLLGESRPCLGPGRSVVLSHPVSLHNSNIYVTPPSSRGPVFIPLVGSSYWSSPSSSRLVRTLISLFSSWVNCLSEWRKINFVFTLSLFRLLLHLNRYGLQLIY